MGMLSDIKNLRIQGAINISKALLDYMEAYGEKHGYGEGFSEEALRVSMIRPTAVIPYNIMKSLATRPGPAQIRKLRKELDNIYPAVSRKAYREVRKLGKSVSIMNHCHSTEFVEAVKYMKKRGMDVTVWVTETRPKMQGKKTAKELADVGIRVNYIVDDAEGFFIHESDIILVGSDSIRPEGVVNKIGTLELAVLGKEFKKPFYSLSSKWKVDNRAGFEIEFRKPSELGFSYPGVRVLNPAFDITPWKYVTGVVMEDGVKRRWRDV